MLDIFITSVNAVAPIVLLIALGFILKKTGFLNENFVSIGNKFVFNICLPSMLFINIYDSMESFRIDWKTPLYCTVVILIFFALGFVTSVLTTKDCKRRGVILQCVFRSNFAIIGLILVERLGGDTVTAGIISAFSIPLFNILAVISLSVFVTDEKSEAPSVMQILLNIVKNPLIISVVLGLVFVAFRDLQHIIFDGKVPFRLNVQLKFVYETLRDLKMIASPLALVVLGGQFEFSAVKGMTKEIIVASFWRVVLAPLIGIGGAYLLSRYTDIIHFGTEIYPTFVALFATPVAVSSAIMARQMNNDGQLATQLVVWTSVTSVLTIFITVFILMSAGLLVM